MSVDSSWERFFCHTQISHVPYTTMQGFDTTDCDNNVVTIGGVRCGTLACSKTKLTVLFPGGTANPTADLKVDVILGPTLNDTKTLTGAVAISDSVDYITSTVAPTSVSASFALCVVVVV